MATLHIYSTRYGVQTIHVFGCIHLEPSGTHSYALPTLNLPAHAIHGGAQGSIYFNSPLACSTRTAHWQAPTHLLSRERMLTATYALDLRSKGRSVRFLKGLVLLPSCVEAMPL